MNNTKFATYKRKLIALVKEMIKDWNAIDTNIEEKQNQLIILQRILAWLITGEKDKLIQTNLPLEVSIADLQEEYLRMIEAADKPTLLITKEELEPQVAEPISREQLIVGMSEAKPKRKYKKREPKADSKKLVSDMQKQIIINVTKLSEHSCLQLAATNKAFADIKNLENKLDEVCDKIEESMWTIVVTMALLNVLFFTTPAVIKIFFS